MGRAWAPEAALLPRVHRRRFGGHIGCTRRPSRQRWLSPWAAVIQASCRTVGMHGRRGPGPHAFCRWPRVLSCYSSVACRLIKSCTQQGIRTCVFTPVLGWRPAPNGQHMLCGWGGCVSRRPCWAGTPPPKASRMLDLHAYGAPPWGSHMQPTSPQNVLRRAAVFPAERYLHALAHARHARSYLTTLAAGLEHRPHDTLDDPNATQGATQAFWHTNGSCRSACARTASE